MKTHWLVVLLVRRVVKQNVRLRKQARKLGQQLAIRVRLQKTTLRRELQKREAEIARLSELVEAERLRRETSEAQWRDRVLELVGSMGISHAEVADTDRIRRLSYQPFDTKAKEVIAVDGVDIDMNTGKPVLSDDELGLEERLMLEEMYKNHVRMGEEQGASPAEIKKLWDEHYDDIIADARAQIGS